MSRYNLLVLSWCGLLSVVFAAAAVAENEGQDDLDKATQLKVTAETLEDLNDVIDRLDTALEKGLDKENTEFAQHLLVSSLVQRGTMFATAVLNVPMDDPQRGMRSMQFRQFALSDLQRAVGLDDTLWDAHLLIGKLQVMPYGDASAARRALSKVVDAAEAPPELKAEAYALRSAVQRDDEKRLADLNRAVELLPKKPDFLRLRGMILLGLEKYDEALASFNRATELVPDAALPYQHRGELYRQKGDREKALEQLTKALELSPESVATLLVRAGVYYELKQIDKALDDIEEAIRIQPQLVHPYLMRAEIYAATDRLHQAIEQLERLVQMSPGHVQLLNRLGSFYLMAGRPRKAIEVLTQVVDQDPENYSALRFRADAHLNIGEHAEAIADFGRALELNEEADESLLNNFAWVLATSPDDELRDGKRAIELATKAAELTAHQTPHILSTLAAAYAETGDFETAKKWSQKAVEIAQKELESADSSDRTQMQADAEQLQKELDNYREGKPVRERQNADETADEPPTADRTLAPSAARAPARTADF